MDRSTLPTYSLPLLLETLHAVIFQMKMMMIPILQLVLPPVLQPNPRHWGRIMDMLITPIHIIDVETTSMMIMSPTTSERLHLSHTNSPTPMRIIVWWRILSGRWPHISSSLLLQPIIGLETFLNPAPTYRLVNLIDYADLSTTQGSTS